MTNVIQLTAAVTYFTVVVVASMSTTDVWRGMTYCQTHVSLKRRMVDC